MVLRLAWHLGDTGGQGRPDQEAQWERERRPGGLAGATRQGDSGEGTGLRELVAARGWAESKEGR